jgi:hypothetical protein
MNIMVLTTGVEQGETLQPFSWQTSDDKERAERSTKNIRRCSRGQWTFRCPRSPLDRVCPTRKPILGRQLHNKRHFLGGSS